MMDERDVVIDRIVSALLPLPLVDDAVKARVLIAVAAERERDREHAARRSTRRGAMWWIARGGAVAAAVAIGVLWLRPTTPVAATPNAVVASAPSVGVARLAGQDSAAEAGVASQPVQLVFRAPAASRVRVVGDFNGWDAEQAPMTRDAASGLWSVTLTLRPGRHVYAFVVDDTLWMRDPRAPASQDADFGRPGSVLLVGRP